MRACTGWPPARGTTALSSRFFPTTPGAVLARFPVLPAVAAIPAAVSLPAVPVGAPQQDAGGAVCVWLLSPDGQGALLQVGFPSMRSDVPGTPSRMKPLTAAGVDLDDPRFPPGEIATAAGHVVNVLGALVSQALAQPDGQGLGTLQSAEDLVNRILADSLTAQQASAALGNLEQ